jgi:uncharacterized protein (TIGR04255 family)
MNTFVHMFGFPQIARTEDFKFKRNFLRTVTFQVWFDEISYNDSIESKLKNLLLADYPNAERMVQGTFKFTDEGVNTAGSRTQGIKFTTKDKSIQLVIERHSIYYLVNGTTYSNFYSFLSLKEKELHKIFDLLRIKSINKTSIRKVNVINFKATQSNFSKVDVMSLLFNSALIANMKVFPLSNIITTGTSSIQLQNEDNRLNLIYGFVKDKSDSSAANAILDIDIYKETKIFTKNLKKELENINNEIFNTFKWALQETTINNLNQE